MNKKATPEYVRGYEDMHDNIKIAMGEVNGNEDTAILLPWMSDLMAAHCAGLRQAYNEGDLVTLAQMIPAMDDLLETLKDMVAVILTSYVSETNRSHELIHTWLDDTNHYNGVTTEKVRENLLEMGWGEDHCILVDPIDPSLN